MVVLMVKHWIKQGWNNVDNKAKNLAEELVGTAVDELGKTDVDNGESDNYDGPRRRNRVTQSSMTDFFWTALDKMFLACIRTLFVKIWFHSSFSLVQLTLLFTNPKP